MTLSTVLAFPLAVESWATHQFLWILDTKMEPLVNFKFRQPLVDILGCHLDYTLSELQSKNEGHSWERLPCCLKWVDPLLVQTFEVGGHAFDSSLEVGKQSFWDKPEESLCSLPVWSHPVSKSIPSLATDSGFQHILQTRWGRRSHELRKFQILGFSAHNHPLFD